MMNQTRPPLRPVLRQLVGRTRQLIRSEDGNLFVTFIPMLAVMMLWGGIAVDLMRFESRRAQVQSVTDRATLAAANLGMAAKPEEIVNDYFDKAGLTDITPKITTPNYNAQLFREVEVKADFELDTLFLRHVNNLLFVENNDRNWKTLSAPADATAVEGVSAVEVSLVLDLSGSMYAYIKNSSPQVRRIDKLKSAAEGFINALLLPEYAGRLSVSLVPYSEQVNIGPTIFSALNVSQKHNFSHCIEFPSSAFTTTTFDTTTTYQQTQNVQFNYYGNGGIDSFSGSTRNQANPALDQPVCPRFDYERVIPITEDKGKLIAAIRQLQPRAGTSIFLGLKWGVSLLDPSFQQITKRLPTSMVSSSFADRPLAYQRAGGRTVQAKNLKYLVLMTDGFNDFSKRLKDDFYDEPSERYYWAHHNIPWAELDYRYDAPGLYRSDYQESYDFYTRTQGVGYMASMCKAARDAGIVIYAISMSGDDDSPEAVSGREEMAKCAGDANNFFATSGPELDQIFAQIARQITSLRLTQ